MKDYTSARANLGEYPVNIDGEHFVLRPKKKGEAFVKLMTVDRNDELKGIAYTQAQMEFLEDALDRDHRPNPRKKKPGHGQESVEGCQACRMYDCLGDDDHPMEIETVLQVASDLVGEVSGRPTGSQTG